MFLFLLLALPAWLYFVVSLYPVPSRGWRGIVVPVFGGLAAGMVTIVITLSLLSRTPFSTDIGSTYTWAWYRGPGWMMTITALGIGALYHFRPTAYSRIREIACWLGAASFVYTTWYALTPEPGFDSYRLFLAPFVWTGASGLVAWLLDRGLRIDGPVSWLFYVLAMLMPSVITFIPVLDALGIGPAAWAGGISVTAGSLVLIYLDSRGRLS